MEQPRGEVRWRTMTDNPWRSTRETWGSGSPDPQGARALPAPGGRAERPDPRRHLHDRAEQGEPLGGLLQKLLSVYELPLSRFFAEEEVAIRPAW
jgi:HTH-type transcriptional repressor of puuD